MVKFIIGINGIRFIRQPLLLFNREFLLLEGNSVHEEVSYDQLISEFINARVEGDNFIWKQGAIAFFLKETMQVSAKIVSSDTGYSPRHISNLVKTFTAFPTEDTRALDLSFSHHMLAAGTDDPAYWLDEAVKNAYSVRELKRAIDGDSPELDPVSVAQRAWKKVEQLIELDNDGSDYLKNQIKLSSLMYE